MKKFIVFFAAIAMVGAFALPPAAVSADWSFYGSARMHTFWVTDDEKATGNFDETDLTHTIQGNSRIGAHVKAGDVTGRFEYGSGPNLRLLYGEWNFGSGKMLVGQSYTPITTLYSNQASELGAPGAFNGDSNMLSMGGVYTGRKPMIQFTFGSFKLAFVTPQAPKVIGAGTYDTEYTIPKIEVKYAFKSDTFWTDIYGGYNSVDVRDPATDASVGLDSYIAGIGGGMNFSAIYFKLNLYVAQNSGSYGVLSGNKAFNGSLYGTTPINATDTDFLDQDEFGYLALIGFKASDMLAFEAGYGAVHQEQDTSPVTAEDDLSAVYLQATITFAPGVFIVPEIGMLDNGDSTNAAGVEDDDNGKRTWFGLKTQINF
jgi:hypothetical protein